MVRDIPGWTGRTFTAVTEGPLRRSGLVDLDRAHISRRLKAARWLAGGLNENGQVVALSPEELAERDALKRNGITANAITEIERMVKRDLRPMHLAAIAEAFGLPPKWFSEPDYRGLVATTDASADERLERIEALVGDTNQRLENELTDEIRKLSESLSVAALARAVAEAQASLGRAESAPGSDPREERPGGAGR